MQKSKQFIAIVQGATLDTNLSLDIPSKDYHMWFFKPGRAILYFCSTFELSRNFFTKAHAGHVEVTRKGYTVQSSKCGPKAENYIRRMLNEGGW